MLMIINIIQYGNLVMRCLSDFLQVQSFELGFLLFMEFMALCFNMLFLIDLSYILHECNSLF